MILSKSGKTAYLLEQETVMGFLQTFVLLKFNTQELYKMTHLLFEYVTNELLVYNIVTLHSYNVHYTLQWLVVEIRLRDCTDTFDNTFYVRVIHYTPIQIGTLPWGPCTTTFLVEGTLAVSKMDPSHCSFRRICFKSLNIIPCTLWTTYTYILSWQSIWTLN